jgi:hypothetical protein
MFHLHPLFSGNPGKSHLVYGLFGLLIAVFCIITGSVLQLIGKGLENQVQHEKKARKEELSLLKKQIRMTIKNNYPGTVFEIVQYHPKTREFKEDYFILIYPPEKAGFTGYVIVKDLENAMKFLAQQHKNNISR